MFERRTKVTEYTREQTIRWLVWLAQSLIHTNLSIFYVESMQPDWLPSRAQRWVVAMVPIIFGGLIGGLIFGLFSGLRVERLVFGMIFGLILGLIGSLLGGLRSGLDHITPIETLRWSWEEAHRYWIFGLSGRLVVGLLSGLIFGLLSVLIGGLLIGGVVGGLVFGLVGGLSTDQILTRTIPNEGIRRSLRNALISFLLFGLLGGLFGGLVFGLVGGLLGGLINGGSAYLKHHILRFLLWRNHYAPLNYIRFLDYAAKRVFLRKVGGGYIFTHRLLMEYFATLEPMKQAGYTKAE